MSTFILQLQYNQSQISLLPWIGNFTQSFLHSPGAHLSILTLFSIYLAILGYLRNLYSPLDKPRLKKIVIISISGIIRLFDSSSKSNHKAIRFPISKFSRYSRTMNTKTVSNIRIIK